MRGTFRLATLSALREMPSEDVLSLLAPYLKADPTYVAVKDSRSRRWHAWTTEGEFELVITGAKWFDTRQSKGGGGAIDLAMHLLGIPFVEAVKALIERGALRGRDYS